MHIKGSKRTYVDSQPGIFIKELQKLECKNPVIVIDEIEKAGRRGHRGDVTSTLLELLNPEQSNQFKDSFLDFEFDFSEVIYICTSNSIAEMLEPLIDRIEVINVPAYLPIEKYNIAKNYLIPNLKKEYGFSEGHHESITLTDAAIMEMINNYCNYEAGVRNLKKGFDRVFRKICARIEDSPAAKALEPVEYQVNSKNLEKFLDENHEDSTFYKDLNKELPIGSVNGLAFVKAGYGSVLKIQIVKRQYGNKDAEKKEGSITHTGRLGEVFTESTQVVKLAAFNFL